MASPTDGSKPMGHGFSKKKKKKPKPNLKTYGSKPNLRMVAKTEIRNGEIELIASASNSSNRAHRHRSSPWPRQSDRRFLPLQSPRCATQPDNAAPQPQPPCSLNLKVFHLYFTLFFSLTLTFSLMGLLSTLLLLSVSFSLLSKD